MDRDELKRQAAYHAIDQYVRDGMVLGLGHGSTIAHALERLASHLKAGRLNGVRCVPVSKHTATAAQSLGIPLTTLDEIPHPDLCIDGADEVDPRLDLIKGLGGALLREKIVAVASARMVVIVDEGKVVTRLGTRAPLPVEVLTFGWTTHVEWLQALGCEPHLRRTPAGAPFVTDSGNYIYDCHFQGGIEDPGALEKTLNNRPGVVENGLFLEIADQVVIATQTQGIQVRQRPGSA